MTRSRRYPRTRLPGVHAIRGALSELAVQASARPWLLRAALFVAVLASSPALARPGGGGSFSGGRHGGGGDGGDDDFLIDIVFLLLQICIDNPAVGVPLLLVAAVVVIARATLANQRARGDWSTADVDEGPARPAAEEAGGSPRAALEAIRGFDEDFSVVLFEDFLYALYAEAHNARGRGQLDRLSAYLTPEARGSLGRAGGAEVRTVVIGGMRYVEAQGILEGSPELRVAVEFEANYAEVEPGQPEQAWYVRDLWRLMRRRTARSKPPRRTRVLGCPNCGAPLDAVIAGRCSHCEKDVATGEFDWVVEGIVAQDRQSRGPMLTADVAEEGTSLPTIVDPDAATRMEALRQRDPAFQWVSFRRRLELIFREFQVAWSARDLTAMRPFLSDNLFGEQRYWIGTYQRQGLRNVTENARILRTQVARVTSDRYFDALTVRVFATGLDYTVTDGGRLVTGSRTRERPYSEYWTLIRSAACTGPARADKTCPHCGAPIKINMAGSCEYCEAKVTSGDFDWVLSRIEQDETYAG